MPLARIIYFVPGVIRSLKAVSGVIREVGAFIASAASSALSAAGAAIAGITGFAAKGSAQLVALFTAGFARVATAINGLALRLKAFFAELAGEIQRAYPQFEILSRLVLSVGEAFGRLGAAAKVAQASVTTFGARARVSIGEAEVAANRAAIATQRLGTSLGQTVTAGAQAAGRGIMGLAGMVARSIGGFLLWQIAITAVFDIFRRLSEWMEARSSNARYRMAVDSLTDGLNAQAIAAARAGRELDSATAAIYRNARAALEARDTKALARYLELQDEVIKREKNLSALEKSGGRDASPTRIRALNQERNPGLFKELDQLRAERKRIEDLLNAPEKAKQRQEALQLRQRENKQQIEELARFEKDSRKALDDQVFQNRMAGARKEIEIYRAAGELRIAQVEQANAKLIKGTNTNAQESLRALSEYISSRQRGELTIEARKREAQIAAAELDRSLMETRLNLEKQIAELKKKVNQYEIEVLDKRLKTEQEIASIRNGSIITTPGGAGGQLKGGAVVTARNDRDAEQTGSDIALKGGNGAAIQNPFTSLRITGTGFQGKGSGTKGKGYGSWVTGQTTINGKDYEILLGHLAETLVKKGDVVSGGAVLGKQGITGRASGPHVTTHVNALNGGDAGAVLSAIEKAWTKGGDPIQTATQTANQAPVRLNLDTTALEGSIGRLKALETQLIALGEAANELDSADKWQKFVDTLYDPNGLQPTIDNLEKAKLAFQALATTSAAAYDPERIRIFNDAQNENYQREEKTKALLKDVNKLEGLTAEARKKAAAEIEEADKKQKKQIEDRMALRLQERAIIEQTAKLEGLKGDTKNVGLSTGRTLISSTFDRAANGTNDFLERRMIQARRDIALKRYDLSEGGTKDISGLATEMNAFAEATMKAARELAAMDKAASQTRVRDMLIQWENELTDTQGIITSLGGSIKNELSGAMSNAVMGVIQGTATVTESFQTMFQNIGAAFLQMATEMIAKALIMQVLGLLNPTKSKTNFDLDAVFPGSFGLPKRAAGGPLNANQPSLVGELGPELFIPERAGTVIPANQTASLLSGNRTALNNLTNSFGSAESTDGNSEGTLERRAQVERAMTSNRTAISNTAYSASTTYNSAFTDNRDSLSAVTSAVMERSMANGMNAPSSMNVNYNVDRINSVDYVTADEFRQGISQAANLGARRGQQQTLDALRQRPAVRRSLGLGQ